MAGLLTNNSGIPSVLVRIRGLDGEVKEWRVPSDVNFRMVLVR